MASISELRARIASGEIKPTGTRTSKVGEGTFTCLISSATYGAGENGNLRGMMTAKVLSGGTDAEVGGEFKIYIQTVNATFAERDIALWTRILVDAGVPEDKIFDDAEDIGDIVSNICTLANKLAVKGKLKLVIKRKAQAKLDAKGKQRFYNDILVDATPEPAATPEPQSGPVTPALVAAIPAPVPVAPVPAAPVPAAPVTKPWE